MLKKLFLITVMMCMSMMSYALPESHGQWVLLLSNPSADSRYNTSSYTDELKQQGVNIMTPELGEHADTLTLEQKVMKLMTEATKTTRMPIQILAFGEELATACLTSELYPQYVDRIISVGGEQPADAHLHCPLKVVPGEEKFKKTWPEVKQFLSADLKDILKPLPASAKRVLFDLSHSQCTDTFKGYETYPYLIPAYTRMMHELGVELVVNQDQELSPELLKDIDLVLMTSPLSNKLQKNLTAVERKALTNQVGGGKSLIFFIDDFHRCDNNAYGANEVTAPFGVYFEKDVRVPFNVGAVSIQNKIFSRRLEIPFSGATLMTGGVPVSLSMQGGYVHASVVELENGGKLYAGSDTMVGLLLGFADGERLKMNMMDTRWWGKDSYQYMQELAQWMLK